MKVPNMKFRGILPTGSRADTSRQTDEHEEAGTVIVKRKGLVRSQFCRRIEKNIFLMFLIAIRVHNEEFNNFTLQKRLLSCNRINEDETHRGDKLVHCVRKVAVHL
jgi:hypothetical protein